ncbi:hypothetical protein GCM10027040_27120 [Halomonas shantousis]
MAQGHLPSKYSYARLMDSLRSQQDDPRNPVERMQEANHKLQEAVARLKQAQTHMEYSVTDLRFSVSRLMEKYPELYKAPSNKDHS